MSRMRDASYSATEFTPAEAAEITGVSQDLQRQWRKREIVPGQKVSRKVNSFELSRLILQKTLLASGVETPETSLATALGPFQILDWACRAEGACLLQSDGGERPFIPDSAIIAGDYVRYLYASTPGLDEWTTKYGPWIPIRDEQKLTNQMNILPQFGETAALYHIIDLASLGSALARRAGRPLIKINHELEPEEGNPSPLGAK